MTPWHGNAFHITDPLWQEPLVLGGFPSQNASHTDRWLFIFVSLNKLLNKQSRFCWFELKWFSCDITILSCQYYNCQWSFNALRPRQNGRHFPDKIWNAFSWMEMYKFWLCFPWNLFLWVQLTIFQHWIRYWLGVFQATSYYLIPHWLVCQHIYESLGLNELTMFPSMSLHPLACTPDGLIHLVFIQVELNMKYSEIINQ